MQERKVEIMKHTHIKYAVLYNFSYMSIGAMTPLIGQYLDGEGFIGSQIGTITAAGTASAIFASMFWGRVYSASKRKHDVLILLCAAAAAVCCMLTMVKSYALFIIIFGLM